MEVSDDDYNLEFRSVKDDAWYTCAVVLDHGNHRLRVKLEGYSQSYFDEVFSIADFTTHREIEQFVQRFRPFSNPVQDYECSRIVQGVIVCAAYRRHEEVRYFDAIVDAVRYKEHTAEECLCSYLLCWQHGPSEGNVTKATIEDVCLLSHGDINPKIIEFTNLMKQQLKGSSIRPQVFGSAGRSSHAGSPELSDHDIDMGGAKTTDRHHYIVLENLEKDLCPLLMMDFIQEHTSITAQTYVFPSLLLETNARGAIMVDSFTKLKRIYDFINNPNHLITSFSGRPWVMAENILRSGTFNTNLLSLQPNYENWNTENVLKVVRVGTEESKKSKQLKDLYLTFRNHLNVLVQRLDTEEKKEPGAFSFCKL
ncbi:putative SAWADEE domain-containing protein [Helianthus debilis subsp. tardiflorus]